MGVARRDRTRRYFGAMTDGMLWAVFAAIGAITFAIRASFVAFAGRSAALARASRALRFVPPAVLGAITLPELLLRQGELDFSPSNARLIAGVLAAAVAWRTKNVLLTIAAGMLAMWAAQALVR